MSDDTRPSRAQANRDQFLETVLNQIQDSRYLTSKCWKPLIIALGGEAITQEELSDVLDWLKQSRDLLTTAIGEVQTVVAIGET